MSAMQTSANGRKLIENFEGLRLTAYADQRGIPTVGYGHTGPDVFLSTVITQEDADAFLAVDLHHAESAINSSLTVPVNQNEFDALVSLVYNIGGGAFAKSTLLRVLNTADYLHAAEQFLVWDRTNGQVNQGLMNRRIAERTLFLTPVVA